MSSSSIVKSALLSIFIAMVPLLFASDRLEFGIPGKSDQIIDREGYALG